MTVKVAMWGTCSDILEIMKYKNTFQYDAYCPLVCVGGRRGGEVGYTRRSQQGHTKRAFQKTITEGHSLHNPYPCPCPITCWDTHTHSMACWDTHMTHTCENITFPQLLLRTVKLVFLCVGSWSEYCQIRILHSCLDFLPAANEVVGR